MGGRLIPPTTELFSTFYAKRADGSDLWWRNMLENPTTVQFDHRCLVRLLEEAHLRSANRCIPLGNHNVLVHSDPLRHNETEPDIAPDPPLHNEESRHRGIPCGESASYTWDQHVGVLCACPARGDASSGERAASELLYRAFGDVETAR